MANINELLKEHVVLDVECLDRIYLNGYIPRLQVPGDLVNFLIKYKGNKIPSPALLDIMTKSFVREVESFAAENNIPVVRFEHGQRKDDIAAKYHQQFTGSEGVVFIGVAQEKAKAFKATKKSKKGYVSFDYTRQSVCVKYYYFYVRDSEFGPGFIKICTYAPFAVKVYLNGHEWVKQQLGKEGIDFTPLDNGFLACADPERLKTLCNQLGPKEIQAFFDKWSNQLPFPLSKEDRQAGYRHELSIWQLEISRTQVFDRPLRGREFFEEVIRENLDLGRPDRVQLVFDRKIIKSTPGLFRTRVIQQGVSPSLHIDYKNSRVKQYFKENRALRTETTINDPKDFGVNKNLANLPYLRTLGININRRLLDVQRVSQNCTMSKEAVNRVTQPTVTENGQKAPGLRFGDPRVMALFFALTLFIHAANGFTNTDLKKHMANLLVSGSNEYSSGQMTYDLRRLRLKGIIHRLPHSHRYVLTPYGRKVALFFTKLDARVFRPAFASLSAEKVDRPLAAAFKQVDEALDHLLSRAKLGKVA